MPAIAHPERFVDSSLEHGVWGLAWTAVESGQLDLPLEASERLLTADLASWGRNSSLWSALGSVQRTLGELGVDFYLFKGLAVERQYYVRTGERPCSDLDVVLAPRDVGRMGQVVQVLEPGHPLLGVVDELIERQYLQSVTVTLGDGTQVDVHVDPLKMGFPLRGAGWMWERTVSIEGLEGVQVRGAAGEPALIQTLIHANRDRFRFLRAHADVVRMIRAGIDWEVFEQGCRLDGLGPLAFSALRAVEEDLEVDLGLPVPRKGLRERAWERLWPAQSRLAGPGAKGRYHYRTIFGIPGLCRGRLADTARFALRRAVPPRSLVRFLHAEGESSYLGSLLRGRVEKAKARRRMTQGSGPE